MSPQNKLALTLFALAALLLLAVGICRAEWQDFKAPGAVFDQGLLQDVASQCTAEGRQRMYADDPLTYCHELTHEVNSRIRNYTKNPHDNAFYVGGSKCFIIDEPQVTLAIVSQYVPSEHRNRYFQTYLLDSRRNWNREPLYILDEWTAYCNGCEFAHASGRNPSSDQTALRSFIHYVSAVLQATEKHDPNYPQMDQLREFICWQMNRTAKLLGPNGKAIVARCYGGQCGGSQRNIATRPVFKPPRPQQPQRPTVKQPPLVPVQPGENPSEYQADIETLKADNQALLVRIQKLELQIVNLATMPGQRGPAGPMGPQGVKGDRGEKGDKGDRGLTGEAGNSPLIQDTGEQHVVVIADRNAPWWRRLNEQVIKTQQTYSGVQVAPLPEFPIGVIPQAVVYENKVPIRVVKGENEVLDLLSRLSRGLPI